MITAIIFDFFDVLRTDGFNRWLRAHAIEQHDAHLRVITEKHDRGETTDLEFFANLGSITNQTGAQVEQECEANNQLNTELVAYIAELRRRGFKTALLSNSNSDYLRGELATYKLEPLFDEIIISSEVGMIKPEPEIFAHILHRLGATAKQCIFTDDNQRHINGATQTGIHGILFTNTAQFRQSLESIIAKEQS